MNALNDMITNVNSAVLGTPSTSSDGNTPLFQAQSIAVQSVAQSMAIAVQDATDMLRNFSTIESTAIGVATAKWIEDPANALYGAIILTSKQVLQDAASLFETIGTSAAKILAQFPSGS